MLIVGALLFALAAGDPPSMPKPDQAVPEARGSTGLPSGDSGEWRAHMLGWSARSRLPAAPAPSLLMERPVATGRMSSSFGARADPFNHSQREHRGVDIATTHGAPVSASADGIVSFSGRAGGYGQLVRIDHPSGMQIRYGHLSRLFVRNGQAVRRGDLIGAVGSTGRSTGDHLHFEIRIDGVAVNPLRPLPLRSDLAPLVAEAATPVEPRWQGFTAQTDALPAAYR